MAKRKSNSNWPTIAICYDFDKTLSPRDMQEFELIPSLGLDTKEFWAESGQYASENGMDRMLSYMKLILEMASSKKVPITIKDFRKMGQTVELFDGVEEWFDRIDQFGVENQVNIEHYVISAGLKEIIEGTKIFKKFKAVYASSFVYDEYERPIWPRQVVNYTTKTQYLFRINKNCLDLSDEESVNQYLEDSERKIPFRNFIYIGDSDTDIPAMRVVKRENGHSIGVYNPTEKNLRKVCELINQERINFFAPADYLDGSMLDSIVKQIIMQIKINNAFNEADQDLKFINEVQSSIADEIDSILGFIDFMKEQIEIDEKMDVESAKHYSVEFLENRVSKIKKQFSKVYDISDFLDVINRHKKVLIKRFKEKNKKQGVGKRTTLLLGCNTNETNEGE